MQSLKIKYIISQNHLKPIRWTNYHHIVIILTQYHYIAYSICLGLICPRLEISARSCMNCPFSTVITFPTD